VRVIVFAFRGRVCAPTVEASGYTGGTRGVSLASARATHCTVAHKSFRALTAPRLGLSHPRQCYTDDKKHWAKALKVRVNS
jgi:hypothetical protein